MNSSFVYPEKNEYYLKQRKQYQQTMSVYQVFPDSYSVPVKNDISYEKRPNTNHRYKRFKQVHFTAGDIEQFENHYNKKRTLSTTLTRSCPYTYSIWRDYMISNKCIMNTFRYIFYKFKKGIFIQIRNGKLETFLPFSNAFFVNEWYDKIDLPEGFKSDLDKRFWYSNNGLLRFESPINETDTGHCQIKHMFQELCNQYQHTIPDIDFFLNKRDFPILKRNRTEPYHNIWDNTNHPLVSHNYLNYVPILSMVSADDFADIPIPTTEDWTRVMAKENVYFAMSKRTIATDDRFDTVWSNKREIAVFRGSNTGIGTTVENNTRLKLCHLFNRHPLFDVGITNWNERYRKVYNEKIISKPVVVPDFSAKPLTIQEQSQYKYIIHIEGHVQAYRLSIELGTRSVVLLVESKYKLWYESLLEPWVHYIPVAMDLSNLEERVQWCIDNDEKCKEIACAARHFYETYLSRSGCMQYLFHLVCKLKKDIPNNTEQYSLYKYPDYGTVGLKQKLRTLEFKPEQKVLFKNNHTIVRLTKDCVIKQSKSYRISHEFYIGYFCINKILTEIPNFNYTLSRISNYQIAAEYIPGTSLFSWIQSNRFNLNQWLFYTMQIMLSISVAQRICFFNHNDLCPWNIILYDSLDISLMDYLVETTESVFETYRIRSNIIPIIIDYDKSNALYELQWISGNDYSSFQDCICYLVSCIYNIIRYQHKYLSSTEQRILLQIFKDCLSDDVYCPIEHIQSFKDMSFFLEDAHRYAHITFFPKGKLNQKNPMDVFKACSGWYSENKTQSCKKVDYIEYTHYSQSKYTDHINRKISRLVNHIKQPILKSYLNCKYLKKKIKHFQEVKYIDLPLMTDSSWDEHKLHFFPKYYLDHINMFIEILFVNGLSKKDKTKWLEIINPYLKTRKNIISYSKFITNFKIQRNIL